MMLTAEPVPSYSPLDRGGKRDRARHPIFPASGVRTTDPLHALGLCRPGAGETCYAR
jgi:hypothetical protein